MTFVYAVAVLIALGFLWLGVRHVRERRRERLLRARLKRAPRPQIRLRGDTERSQMRANEDPTTVGGSIARKEEPSPGPAAPGADGTRPPEKP